MEATYIIIGGFVSLILFFLGYSVRGVRIHEERLDDNEDDIDELMIRLNTLERKMNTQFDSVQETIENTQDDLSKSIKNVSDSIPPTNADLVKRVEKIEEESYRLRMNL